MSAQSSRKRGKPGESGSGGSGKKKPRANPAQLSLTEKEIDALGLQLLDACKNGKTAESKRLVARGAPVDWQDGCGRAPLHWASRNGHTEIVMLLLENKCNLNITDKWGNTPLILAAYDNKMDTVRALVEAGCDITIRGYANKTAAERAKENGNDAIERYLTNHRFLPAYDESGQLRRVEGRATRAMRRDLLESGMLPAGPLSIIKEFATGKR